ncbi:MAG: DUF2292 domain-containing protein [Chitinispirillaceae bacterium]
MVHDETSKKRKNTSGAATKLDPGTRKEILDTIESVSFGEVVVTIHDRRVVQIEKKEKRRL